VCEFINIIYIYHAIYVEYFFSLNSFILILREIFIVVYTIYGTKNPPFVYNISFYIYLFVSIKKMQVCFYGVIVSVLSYII